MKNLAYILILIFITVYSDNKLQAENINDNDKAWEVAIGYSNYISYSQQKTDIPMLKGFPILNTRHLNLGLNYHIKKGKKLYLLSLETTLPSDIDSDNGTGNNYLIKKSGSSYYWTYLSGHLTFPLFNWRDLVKLRHGINTGFLYEYRNLRYTSGNSEKIQDINLYLGPNITAKGIINKNWSIDISFDARFHLPYLNYGQLQMIDDADATYFKSKYHSFYYQTLLGIDINYKQVSLGIVSNNIVGYSNAIMNFSTEGIIHNKLDRISQIKLSYKL